MKSIIMSILNIFEKINEQKSNIDRGTLILSIVATFIYSSIFICCMRRKDKDYKDLKLVKDVLDKIKKKEDKGNIKGIYKDINEISLGKIEEYFKDTVILSYFNNRSINNNYKKHKIYYYHTGYNNSIEDYNKRIRDKKVFYKFYSLINKLLMRHIDDNSHVNYLSIPMNFILFIWTTLTLIFNMFDEYEKMYLIPNLYRGILIWVTSTLIIVYFRMIFYTISRKYKLQGFYMEINQEVEAILEKLDEEICTLEKIINTENVLEEIKDEKNIKKSLKIEKAKLEIQKEVHKKELKEIDEFYNGVEIVRKIKEIIGFINLPLKEIKRTIK